MTATEKNDVLVKKKCNRQAMASSLPFGNILESTTAYIFCCLFICISKVYILLVFIWFLFFVVFVAQPKQTEQALISGKYGIESKYELVC